MVAGHGRQRLPRLLLPRQPGFFPSLVVGVLPHLLLRAVCNRSGSPPREPSTKGSYIWRGNGTNSAFYGNPTDPFLMPHIYLVDLVLDRPQMGQHPHLHLLHAHLDLHRRVHAMLLPRGLPRLSLAESAA